jgi:hypothetical protein
MAQTKRSRRGGPAPGEKDKRRSRRRDVSYPVAIENIVDGSAIPCVIQDISETGAKLGLRDLVDVPDEFILRLAENRPASRHCHTVWRAGHSLGVRFVEEDVP